MSSAVDLRALSMSRQLTELVRVERQINALHARQLDLINAIDDSARRSRFEMDKDFIAEDVAAALRLSSLTARDRLLFAREMRRMPRLLDLLHSGDITLMHARVCVKETLPLDAAQVDALLDRVLVRATEQTVGQFARSCRRAALAVGVQPEERRVQAYADRRVATRPAGDGMSELYAYLGAADAAAIMARVETDARRVTPGDERTLQQKRADALVAAILDGGGVTTTVNVVTVAASTLAGRDDEPAELARHGPISAEHARGLAAGSEVRLREFVVDTAGRLLDIDDDRCTTPGHLLDFGRTTRVPPANLDRFVRARDVTCRFPGCTHPAEAADLDHVIAWINDGATSAANLHALCRRHHTLKHEGGWKVRRTTAGVTVWTSPTGLVYRVPPRSHLPRGPAPPI